MADKAVSRRGGEQTSRAAAQRDVTGQRRWRRRIGTWVSLFPLCLAVPLCCSAARVMTRAERTHATGLRDAGTVRASLVAEPSGRAVTQRGRFAISASPSHAGLVAHLLCG